MLYAFIVTYSFCRWAIALTFAFQRIN
ncbi:hypothetical protein CFSAN00323_04460 [Salmonella enterica subsp. enterica serovar Heidelberg str. CFSAN00323]|nr:hypothetical protein CFSAN00323_04460 [Salmonella enterica subsp. enterica serovar Heidelberg str. CFSAN00323]RFN03339.1 hypothetical protein CFSAN002067_09404 [Salmonella enterica subsp. enterica serovar Heidelberg str. CFSAN002067]